MNKIPKPFDRLRPQTANAIVRLHRQGLSQRLIAREAGVSQATVSRVVSQHLSAITVPLSERAQALTIAPVVRRPGGDDGSAIALYRLERDRRAERRQQDARMLAAKAEFAERMERDKQAGKGGRPTGSRNGGNSLAGKLVKPGKPRLELKSDPLDALVNSLSHYPGAA